MQNASPQYRVAVIGCGSHAALSPAREGYSIAYSHATAYGTRTDTTIVAAADIKQTNAQAFADTYNVPRTYTDYHVMLEQEQPDIVSICTWPGLHSEMAIDALQAGARMVLCEKPMAVSLPQVTQMLDVEGTTPGRLYVNHQRRFATPYSDVARAVKEGSIGDLMRLEGWVGDAWDLMSWGTHWVDMHRYFTGDQPIAWVFAQASMSGRSRYGHRIEDQLLMQYGFENGVLGLCHIGSHLAGTGIIATGTRGVAIIQNESLMHISSPLSSYGQPTNGFDGAIQEMIDSYERARPSLIDASVAAQTTEALFAAYISANTDEIVQLPVQDRSFTLTVASES